MKKRGSITIFSAMCIMLLASFLFALLEAARTYGLDAYADMKSELSLDSACAEYQPYLWEKYHLLCLDGAYGGKQFSMDHVAGILHQRAAENLNTIKSKKNVLNIFAMKAGNVVPESFQVLTDGDGAVFLQQIAVYMKENLPLETARTIYEKYKQGEKVEADQGGKNSVENADAAIKEARKQKTEASETEPGSAELGLAETGTADTEAEVKENPLDIVLGLKSNPILEMIIGDTSEISNNQIQQDSSLLQRNVQKGTEYNFDKINWYEKILILEYIDRYFFNYQDRIKDHALAYEMEYILCGKEDDRSNLEGTVNRLLLLREAANVTYIVSNNDKLNQAAAIANALAGFTGNPGIIKVVQVGVVAAWAYLESIQDVRALLSGDKIALIKSNDQWTVDTGHLLESFQSSSKAKNCTNGLTYQQYLKQLLFLERNKKLAYRTMDIMERNACLNTQYANCRMDYMISSFSCTFEFESEPLFFRLIMTGTNDIGRLRFLKPRKFSYFNI